MDNEILKFESQTGPRYRTQPISPPPRAHHTLCPQHSSLHQSPLPLRHPHYLSNCPRCLPTGTHPPYPMLPIIPNMPYHPAKDTATTKTHINSDYWHKLKPHSHHHTHHPLPTPHTLPRITSPTLPPNHPLTAIAAWPRLIRRRAENTTPWEHKDHPDPPYIDAQHIPPYSLSPALHVPQLFTNTATQLVRINPPYLLFPPYPPIVQPDDPQLPPLTHRGTTQASVTRCVQGVAGCDKVCTRCVR